ncbi:hypothetical protein LXL04_001599 [Taraxacum kok-saghyz]
MLPINTLFYNPKQVSIALISNFITSEQNMVHKASIPWKISTAVNHEAGISVKVNEEENLPYDKNAALEETVKNLHEQVACLLCECNAKDELMAEHMKTTQEAITEREKAEAEVAIWKQELEDTLQHNVSAYERLVDLNASLKNCKTQLNSLKLEQNQWVNLEKSHKKLESKYTETRKKLANLTLENALLTKALVKKQEDHVSNQISKPRNADVANWQHQESAKLEAEKQRLRLLVKKRVPVQSMGLMMKKISEMEEENGSLKEEIVCMEKEVGRVKESKRIIEDQFENLKLVNIDLDQQLSGVKCKLKEALRRVSVLEMELEDKSQQFEGLESTCLELQLQLTTKDEVTEDRNLLQTGSEITPELTNKNYLSPHSSLRDHMAADDGFHREDVPNSLMIKEIISDTETKDPSGPHYSNELFGVKNVVPQALSVVPWKKRVKRIELLRKLLFRRKRGGSKKKVNVFAAYNI